MFTMATNLYDRYYGRESRELMNANDCASPVQAQAFAGICFRGVTVRR